MLFSTFFSYFANGQARGPMWYWEQCDPAARSVVIIVALCSIWSFSAIIQKLIDLKELREKNIAFERRTRKVQKFLDLRLERSAKNGPYEILAVEALATYKQYNGIVQNYKDVEICMGHVEGVIQRSIAKVMVRYEKSMVLLSTFVSGGPFLGLLGTVYGVMVTFGSLTEKASISQLAPGVSGALVATLSGLLLAIPAVISYNYLLSKTKIMTTELENFASLLADQIENEILGRLRQEELEQEAASKHS